MNNPKWQVNGVRFMSMEIIEKGKAKPIEIFYLHKNDFVRIRITRRLEENKNAQHFHC